ncbi:LysM peptidoglycan-binding domain-containing protein [Bacillus salacetis]|uniref:LysM peptidoglycan-binding domain-containing protein n=1 Tax=Bacillus salacetis TaxID=2315464 RepID=A0A3A1QR39_9BACI|nr:LysM peptidoglycan-binding domain-containing protein [Bacillus salacetis]RIW28749.1 LysM peptidoglycan-binding domain-containing protein [Bacillus salacetis]
MLVSIWKNYSYVILLMGLVVVMGAVALINAGGTDSYHQVTVQEGDSLWTIAAELSDDYDMSTNDLVEWVSEKNNLATDIIKPGDSLIVPGGEELHITDNNIELASGKE